MIFSETLNSEKLLQLINFLNGPENTTGKSFSIAIPRKIELQKGSDSDLVSMYFEVEIEIRWPGKNYEEQQKKVAKKIFELFQ